MKLLIPLLVSLFVLVIPFQSCSQKKKDKEVEIVYDYDIQKVTIADPLVEFVLDPKLKESSGLIFYREALWTHNDSGNDPIIYKVDTSTGFIDQEIRLEGAKNYDWEDIAQDDEYVYVGDFGNNRGIRKDLRIYRVSKENIPQAGDADVVSEVIEFNFSDQETFEDLNRANNYDCESMFVSGEQLFLLSKNWINGYTRLYQLPKTPGSHEAEYLGTFKADGLVTGADINQPGNRLILIGYKNFVPFVTLFKRFIGNDFFAGESIRVDLPFMAGSQTEGICFSDSVNVLISCEQMNTDQQVYHTNIKDWENGSNSEVEMAQISNWEYTILEKKKKHERYLAIDISALRLNVFEIWIEKEFSSDFVTFHSYKFDKHMGKIYVELDVYPIEKGKYKAIVGSGSLKEEKEFMLDKH